LCPLRTSLFPPLSLKIPSPADSVIKRFGTNVNQLGAPERLIFLSIEPLLFRRSLHSSVFCRELSLLFFVFGFHLSFPIIGFLIVPIRCIQIPFFRDLSHRESQGLLSPPTVWSSFSALLFPICIPKDGVAPTVFSPFSCPATSCGDCQLVEERPWCFPPFAFLPPNMLPVKGRVIFDPPGMPVSWCPLSFFTLVFFFLLLFFS